jgi:DegV family protein with EDD domain
VKTPVAGIGALDGERLGLALRAGIRRLIACQEHLNKINVFPVPDGDTGTNMTLTMGAVLAALRQHSGEHAGQILLAVADAAIDGARGNSGAILAQFFVGLAERLGKAPTLTAHALAEGAASGARYAREALSEPCEGTLITILADFATELAALVRSDSTNDFAAVFREVLARLRVSLERTREQLDALASANVVDAGAQGFVELIQGISDYFDGKAVADDLPIEVQFDSQDAAGSEIDLKHRFCTECIVTGDGIDHRKLREGLAALGSGVVVAGTARKAKVHVHVNDTRAVFRLAREFGEVSGQKADDMRKQQDAAHHRHRRGVAIVVDSSADIPDEELERLEIHMVPMRVHFGERSYLDKVSMRPEEFYRELADNPQHPKTSQPPPGDFRRIFEFLASHYETVVSINVTARVSGTLAAAQGAAERVRAHGKVIVIDSRNASLGQGLLAMYAAECAQAGMNGQQVSAAVQAMVPRVLTLGLLRNLDFAVRGGRVPRFVQVLTDLLHLTPVMLSERSGRVGAGTVIFGRHNLRTRFARLVRSRMRDDVTYRVAVGHAQVEEEGRALLEEICADRSNIRDRYLTALGHAIGAHGGPGMLVVGLQEYTSPGISS